MYFSLQTIDCLSLTICLQAGQKYVLITIEIWFVGEDQQTYMFRPEYPHSIQDMRIRDIL
jgi:hypothetical protein